MSETIQGSKSTRYCKEQILNYQNSGDTMQHLTVQEVVGKRGAADVVIHGSTTMGTGKIIEAGSAQRLIKSTAHGAKRGWIMRPSTGQSVGEEITIVEVIDDDTFAISAPFDLAISDTFDICKLITPNYTEEGDLNVVVNGSGPVQFDLNGTPVDVSMDTTNPANIQALPTELVFLKDSVKTRVSYDTANPTNSEAVPVNIVTVNGQGISTTVDLSGAQINVHLTDRGASPDAIRIGDGTNLMAVNSDLEALVHDQDVLDELDSHGTYLATITTEVGEINTKTPQLGKALEAVSVPVVLPDTQIAALTPTPAITGYNLESTQLLVKAKTDNIDVLLSTRASNADLLLMSAKLPAALGQKTMAASLAVTLASDQSVLSVTQAAPSVVQTDQTQNAADTGTTTFTKPANAKNMVIYNNASGGTNAANSMRWGSSPNFTGAGSGALMLPGSSTALLPASTFLTIAADANATANITVIWFY